MKKRVRAQKHIIGIVALLFIILDSKNAAKGAQDGIDLCMKSVIPALFPALVFTDYIIKNSIKSNTPLVSKMFRLCNLPAKTEKYFLAGLLGGYPVGARLIGQDFHEGLISIEHAKNALLFCNNVGPSFLFGICGALFNNKTIPLALWIIHISSAIISGIMLCSKNLSLPCTKKPNNIHHSFTSIVINCTKTMAVVCGWIVLFRVLLYFINVWLLWIFPPEILSFVLGFIELTNGIVSLSIISNWQTRFILCCVLLSFGGICIAMQTGSVIGKIPIRNYLKGKIFQAAVSLLLSLTYINCLKWCRSDTIKLSLLLLIISLLIIVLGIAKKHVAFPKKIIYNGKKAVVR